MLRSTFFVLAVSQAWAQQQAAQDQAATRIPPPRPFVLAPRIGVTGDKGELAGIPGPIEQRVGALEIALDRVPGRTGRHQTVDMPGAKRASGRPSRRRTALTSR